jgi:hypothetical protein
VFAGRNEFDDDMVYKDRLSVGNTRLEGTLEAKVSALNKSRACQEAGRHVLAGGGSSSTRFG